MKRWHSDERAAAARRPRANQGIRRVRGRRRGRPRGSAGHDPLRDRPQRRGQDHAVPAAHRNPPSDQRHDPLRRQGHGRRAAPCRQPSRPGPVVPDHERLPAADRARVGAGRGPGPAAARTWNFVSARHDEVDRRGDGAARARLAWPRSPDAQAQTLSHGDQRILEVALALATRPACCCSTSRPRACPRRKPSRMVEPGDRPRRGTRPDRACSPSTTWTSCSAFPTR